jgi:hypothetical protein
LVSASQNVVEHQLTLTQPNQVIWYSLEPKNVNDFMSFVRSQIRGATGLAFRAKIWSYIDDRNHLHAAVANTLRFGPKPELADAWEARGDIDIEEILRILLKSIGPVGMKIAEADAPTEIAQIPLIIENVMENSFLVTIKKWTTKIHDAIERSVRTSHPVVDVQCVQAIIDGLRASSDKSRSTRWLYEKAKALSNDERPKTPEDMIKWVVGLMRNVKIALELSSLHGWEYNPANQLHHKKSGTSMMDRDLTKQAGGGGKTAKKPVSAATPPLCNICGGNYSKNEYRRKGFPDTNPDVSVRWSDSAVGKAWKERHGCNWRPGGPTVTLENYVKPGEQTKKKARTSPASSGSRKPVSHLILRVHAWNVSK